MSQDNEAMAALTAFMVKHGMTTDALDDFQALYRAVYERGQQDGISIALDQAAKVAEDHAVSQVNPESPQSKRATIELRVVADTIRGMARNRAATKSKD